MEKNRIVDNRYTRRHEEGSATQTIWNMNEFLVIMTFWSMWLCLDLVDHY